MNHPELWEKNRSHGDYLSALLNEHKNKFDWRADGTDTLMDIGCAGGGTTIESVLPIMPSNFDRLIGVDISRSMINYAQQTYSLPKVEFKTFDIVDGDTNELPQVDHIVCTYVFHWLRDHEKGLSNIYNLLKPGGDCFLVFLSPFMYHPVYEQIARYPKWSQYIKDVKDVIPSSYFSKNPESDFEQLLKKCNFSTMEISTRVDFIEKFGVSHIKNSVKTLDAYFKHIPLTEYDAFTTDFAELIASYYKSAAVNINHPNESSVYLPYYNLIAYAKK